MQRWQCQIYNGTLESFYECFLLFFYLRFLCDSYLLISCLYEAMEKLKEINTFRFRKTTVSSTFLIRFTFPGQAFSPINNKFFQDKYDGKLEKEMKGPTFQLVSKLMKVNPFFNQLVIDASNSYIFVMFMRQKLLQIFPFSTGGGLPKQFLIITYNI